MSQYTSIIMIVSGFENQADRLEEVCKFRYGDSEIQFLDCNKNDDEDCFPRFTYSGFYNNFSLREFIIHLQTKVNWEQIEHVQLLVREEYNEDCSFYRRAGAKLIYQAKCM
jgi:hypothetical protein